MLPILRILPVGGVFLAIFLLVLALNPPASRHAQLTPGVVPIHGAMIARDDHPEWRQFLMLAAIRRAEELNRLRELPDIPTITAPQPPAKMDGALEPPEVAGLPATRGDSDPDADDATGSIVQQPAATIPIDIGETSSFELPVGKPEEQPPVIRAPQRVKSRNESRIERAPRARRAKAKAKAEPPFNLFDTLFGTQKTKQSPKAGINTTAR